MLGTSDCNHGCTTAQEQVDHLALVKAGLPLVLLVANLANDAKKAEKLRKLANGYLSGRT